MEKIGNYTPVSLVYTDYKIMTKVITEQIKPTLSQIIGKEQQGFIEEGGITGNLIMGMYLINL